MDSGRIGIQTGISVQLIRGRAISRGLPEPRVMPAVETWLRTHTSSPHHEVVERWLLQKREQVEEDVRTQGIRNQRDEINGSVDRAAKQSNLPGDLVEVGAHAATFEAEKSPAERGVNQRFLALRLLMIFGSRLRGISGQGHRRRVQQSAHHGLELVLGDFGERRPREPLYIG